MGLVTAACEGSRYFRTPRYTYVIFLFFLSVRNEFGMVFVHILVSIKTYTIMKKKTLTNLIEFFALCGAVAFFCGLVDPWALIACMIFGGTAAVLKLFYNIAEE